MLHPRNVYADAEEVDVPLFALIHHDVSALFRGNNNVNYSSGITCSGWRCMAGLLDMAYNRNLLGRGCLREFFGKRAELPAADVGNTVHPHNYLLHVL